MARGRAPERGKMDMNHMNMSFPEKGENMQEPPQDLVATGLLDVCSSFTRLLELWPTSSHLQSTGPHNFSAPSRRRPFFGDPLHLTLFTLASDCPSPWARCSLHGKTQP